jgi:hypothetical protein
MTLRLLNIAILLVAIVLSALLVKKFFFQPSQNSNYTIALDARSFSAKLCGPLRALR